VTISLVQPSLLLNSYAFNDLGLGSGMEMDSTWQCPRMFFPENLVNWIAVAWKQAPGRYLHHVVLNFHGKDHKGYFGEKHAGRMVAGKYVETEYYEINPYNGGVFRELKKQGVKIGTIWFHSCEVAQTFIGKYLCGQIAQLAGCNVVAAEQTQYEWWGPLMRLPLIGFDHGEIDDYEGPVYIWNAKGQYSRFYPNGQNWN
jgi:hypothetical protein